MDIGAEEIQVYWWKFLVQQKIESEEDQFSNPEKR